MFSLQAALIIAITATPHTYPDPTVFTLTSRERMEPAVASGHSCRHSICTHERPTCITLWKQSPPQHVHA
eukprot:361382-Chlamydomonas_euryale.AAC.11